jgi:hypothetical protein
MNAFYLVLLLVALPAVAADDCFCLFNNKVTDDYRLPNSYPYIMNEPDFN